MKIAQNIGQRVGEIFMRKGNLTLAEIVFISHSHGNFHKSQVGSRYPIHSSTLITKQDTTNPTFENPLKNPTSYLVEVGF